MRGPFGERERPVEQERHQSKMRQTRFGAVMGGWF